MAKRFQTRAKETRLHLEVVKRSTENNRKVSLKEVQARKSKARPEKPSPKIRKMRKNIKGNVSSDAKGKNDCQKGV